MLNRQRVVLSMIAEAGGHASRLAITKWAFLLKNECDSRGGSAFYQFLPYKYGPFSFCLFQEASALVRNGMIEENDQNSWRLTREGCRAARQVKSDVHGDIKRVIQSHASKSSSALVDYVYDRHPWYTVNSELRRVDQKTVGRAGVYTAGYEGLLVDGFLDGLMRKGIERIIDVRSNPVSRRYGFHKTTLNRLSGNVGIEYAHYPQLGIESQQRQDLDQPGARERLFDDYAASTLVSERHAIKAVARLVEERPSVLVCMEARHCDCHRSRLATEVAAESGLSIHHLSLGR